jgi:hypothetical protein
MSFLSKTNIITRVIRKKFANINLRMRIKNSPLSTWPDEFKRTISQKNLVEIFFPGLGRTKKVFDYLTQKFLFTKKTWKITLYLIILDQNKNSHATVPLGRHNCYFPPRCFLHDCCQLYCNILVQTGARMLFWMNYYWRIVWLNLRWKTRSCYTFKL